MFPKQGSNAVLPTITLPTLDRTTDLKLEKRRTIFLNTLFIGYTLGCIFAGIVYEFFDVPKHKQAIFSGTLIVMAITTACLPVSSITLTIATNFFISGFCVKFCKIGIISYAVALFDTRSNACLQFLFFLQALGVVITITSAVADHREFLNMTNISLTDEVKFEAFQKLMISHGILGTLIAAVALAWVCSFYFSPKEYKLEQLFINDRCWRTSPTIFVFSVITILPLIFISSYVEETYPILITKFACDKLETNNGTRLELVYLFWGCFVIGRFISIGIAYKFLTPFQMIAIDLGLLLCCGCFLPLTTSEEKVVLWVAAGISGLAASSLLPSTFGWLHEHVYVTSRVVAGCIFISTTSLFISIHLKHPQLSILYENPLYSIVLAPIFYAVILAIQAIVYKQRNRSWNRPMSTARLPTTFPILQVLDPTSQKVSTEELQSGGSIKDLDSLKSSVQDENSTTMKILRNMEFPDDSVIETDHSKSLIERKKQEEEAENIN
ncbi:uncharacterized protein TNCT_147711 [Trichonephila clavata]|uniref:Uncharacterized protein n=1 Tax=Trichonephila clavata TaxID=2740835 RepID=A0A8X6HA78_TRICU|nr:uncharacterized protein TNCT_147711 [Trichonephila clavata]